MKKFYEKNELGFAIAWIVAYCVLMSLGDNISERVGIISIASLPIAFLLSFTLFMFLKNNHKLEEYGLIKPQVNAKKMLYYIPLFAILLVNVFYGVGIYYSILEIILYILTMLCVGFLEEVIFRGLLFNVLKKDSINIAIIISSITFGMGHILNLLNGREAELLPQILQIIYASAAGFAFVMVFVVSKSLISVILTHGIFNSLSIFGNSKLTDQQDIMLAIFMSVVCFAYAYYLSKINKYKNEQEKTS